MQVAPRFSYAQRLAALKDSIRRYNAAGTTSVYEGHGISPVVIRAYKELREKDELTVRSHLVLGPTWDAAPDVAIDSVLGNWAAYASGQGLGDDMLRISGIHTTVGDSPQDDIRKRRARIRAGPDTALTAYCTMTGHHCMTSSSHRRNPASV